MIKDIEECNYMSEVLARRYAHPIGKCLVCGTEEPTGGEWDIVVYHSSKYNEKYIIRLCDGHCGSIILNDDCILYTVFRDGEAVNNFSGEEMEDIIKYE